MSKLKKEDLIEHSFIPRKGLNLYSFNIETKMLVEIDKSQQIVFDTNCYYFEALNIDSAEKKVKNFFANKRKTLNNLRIIK